MKKSKTIRFAIGILLLQSFVVPAGLLAQDTKQADVNAAIRKEGMENSKIMHTLHILDRPLRPAADRFAQSCQRGEMGGPRDAGLGI